MPSQTAVLPCSRKHQSSTPKLPMEKKSSECDSSNSEVLHLRLGGFTQSLAHAAAHVTCFLLLPHHMASNAGTSKPLCHRHPELPQRNMSKHVKTQNLHFLQARATRTKESPNHSCYAMALSPNKAAAAAAPPAPAAGQAVFRQFLGCPHVPSSYLLRPIFTILHLHVAIKPTCFVLKKLFCARL